MGILLDASDIFDIAIEIERNGAAFYRQAAANLPEADARHELLELAAMEDRHEVTFAELKRDLVKDGTDDAWYDRDGEAAMYLQSFARGRVFDMTEDPRRMLTPKAPLKDVLTFALQRERDSVAFFVGVKEWVPAWSGADKIEAIIKQEMAHVALLSRRLEEVARQA